MKEWLIKKCYPEAVIEKVMKKVCFSKQVEKSKKVEKEVPFDVNYHPLNRLTFIIHRKLYLCYMNQDVKNVFTLGPIVSFWSARKIRRYLVKGKLHPSERTVGSETCGKSGCEVCLSIEETDTLQAQVKVSK